jgi:CubicO group peptidase (beta-lactamase class C family)
VIVQVIWMSININFRRCFVRRYRRNQLMRDLISLAVALIILSTASAERARAGNPDATTPDLDPAWKCGSRNNQLNNGFYANNALLEDHVANSPAPLQLNPARGDAKLHLSNALQLLIKEPYIQSFLVAKNNKIIFEAYFNGMTKYNSANVHSASKSIWGAATGIAISKGILPSIDTPIKALLPEHYGRYFDTAKKSITLKNLLTMTSCLEWDEDVTERHLKYVRDPEGNGRDWIAAILDGGIRPQTECTLGKTFGYSTGNSQLISAILQEALKRKHLGQSACEFIQTNIFDKIGIAADKWAFYDQGYFAGGHSLWLSPKELMKFGLLYLNNGRWNSTQVIPKKWVKDSKTARIKCQSPGCSISDDSHVPDGYGYYFWLGRLGNHRVTISWGYGGQMIYIFDDIGAVVVITTDTVHYNYDGKYEHIPEDRVMTYIERVMTEEVLEAVK